MNAMIDETEDCLESQEMTLQEMQVNLAINNIIGTSENTSTDILAASTTVLDSLLDTTTNTVVDDLPNYKTIKSEDIESRRGVKRTVRVARVGRPKKH